MIVGKNPSFSRRRHVVDLVSCTINSSRSRGKPLCAAYHLAPRDYDVKRRDFTSHRLGQERAEHKMVFARKQNHLDALIGYPFKALSQCDSRKSTTQNDDPGIPMSDL